MLQEEICFFLHPAEPVKSQLSALIKKLAIEYNCAYFVPHVTAYSGQLTEEEVQQAIGKITNNFSLFELEYQELDYTDKFYKTLFVQFAKSEKASAICETIRATRAKPSDYKLNPHLSLMYKRMPTGEQKKLAETLDAPKGGYLIDSISVVATHLTEDDEAVRNWRTVFEGTLKG